MKLKDRHFLRYLVGFLLTVGWLGGGQARACSPVVDLSVTWSVVGNELRINLNSHTGYQCCFTGRIELRCAAQAFTGNATHNTNTVCKGTGNSSFSTWSTAAVPYQQVVINLSAYCPGAQLKWRAREQSPEGFGSYTPTYTFTVPGVLAPLTVTPTANPTTVCPGGCTTLSATSTGSCGTPTYSWSPGGAGASVSVCPATTTSYTVTVTDPGLLCPQVRTATSSVTVATSPPAVAGTASVLPATVCSGQSVTLSLSGSSGNIQWQSSTNAGGPWTNIGGATGSTYTWPSLTATTYFRAQVSSPCQTVTSNVVSATVNPAPQANFTATSVCQGAATVFTNTSTISSGSISTYQWDFGSGGATSSQASPSHTYAAAGTYTVSLTVTSAAGCSHQTTQSVTVNPRPSVAFTATTVCAGMPTVFTNTSSISSGSISTWQWNFGDGSGTSGQQSPSYTYAQPGTYTATLTATSAAGCSDQATQTITVRPTPTVAFSATTVCAGEASVFSNTSSISSGSISTYQWDFGSGGATSNQVSPSHTYAAAGSYTVSLQATSALGCTAQATQQVTVRPRPVVAFSAIPVCAGQSMGFTNTSTIASGSITGWQWDFAGQATSTQASPSHTFAAPGTYSVTLTAQSDQGCTNVLTQAVTVHPNPVAQFAMSPVCEGSATSFTDQSTISAPGQITGWQWAFGDGGTSTAASPSHNYASAGSFPVTLTVTSANGCQHSSTQQATVHPTPVSSFTFSDICQSSQAVFVNTSSVTSGSITSNSWNTGVGTSSLVNPPAQTYPGAGTYTVSLDVATAFGCTHGSQQQITVFPVPVAAFQFTEVCFGEENIFINASTISGGTITTTDWDFGDGVGTSGQTSPSYTYGTQGSYMVVLSVTSDQGCTDAQTHSVQVFALPVPAFNVADVCEYDPAVFVNESTGAVSYTWDLGDGTGSTDNQPAPHQYTFGTYDAVLTALSGNGCSASITRPVTVHPAPVAAFTFAAVCQGVETPFMDQSMVAGGGQIAQWDWNFGNTVSAQGSGTPAYAYPTWGSYDVSLTVTTDNGCIDQMTAGPVVVHPLPQVQFSSGLTNCFGEVTALQDFSTLANAPDDVIVSWAWTFSDGGASTMQHPSHIFTQEGMQTATLEATSNNGCVGTATYNVEIYALPRVLFMADTTRGCQPFRAQFIDQSSIPAPYFITDWQWDFGDGSQPVMGQYPVHTYYTPSLGPMDEGIFSVTLTVTSANGCVSTETYTDYMTEYPKPNAWFDVTPRRAELLFARMQVTDLSSPNVVEWEYDFDEGMNQFVQHPLHVYQDTGTFTITQYVTTVYGCLDTAQTQVIVDPEFYFYIPNTFTPNSDAHNQTFYGTGVGVVSYHMLIFDRWGSQLFESNDMDYPWDGTKNGHPVQQGVYSYMFNIIDIKGDPHQYVGHVNLVR